MKKKQIIVLVLIAIAINVNAQITKRDSIEIIAKAYSSIGKVSDKFENSSYPDGSLFIMYSNIKMDSVYHPIQYDYFSTRIFIYPRSYIVGFNISYWMVIDSFRVEGNYACIFFRIVSSNDNWVEANDKTILSGKVYLKRSVNELWKIENKKFIHN